MADTAVETIGDIIEEQGGTTDATTVVEALEDLGDVISGGGGGITVDTTITEGGTNPVTGGAIYTALSDVELAFSDIAFKAADDTTSTALTALGYDHEVFVPSDITDPRQVTDKRVRLAWINGTTLEIASFEISGDLTTMAITAYARGAGSIASGVMGVDDTWTITTL